MNNHGSRVRVHAKMSWLMGARGYASRYVGLNQLVWDVECWEKGGGDKLGAGLLSGKIVGLTKNFRVSHI